MSEESEYEKLLKKNTRDIIDIQYKNMVKETHDKLIMYCRQMQKNYIEGDGNISGVYVLGEMLQNGSINVVMFMNILPAIESYNKPYELKES